MKVNKKIAAVAVATALSIGSFTGISAAHADTVKGMVQPDALINSVLAGLVTKGTITQTQSDAIVAAIKAAAPAPFAGGKGMGPLDGGFGGNTAARQAVITSYLGVTAADLKTARQAGKSLATIATGAGKTAAGLITALVAYDNSQIDAAVTAGKLTSAQATTLKANVTTRVTNEVNNVGGPMGGDDNGGMQGMRGGHGMKGGSGSTGTLNVPGTTGTTTSAKALKKATTKKPSA